MNDTAGLQVFVPSMHAFGAIPRFTPHTTPLLLHSGWMRAMVIARLEMAEIPAYLRIQHDLRKQVPPATHYLVNPSDYVYIWYGDSKQ